MALGAGSWQYAAFISYRHVEPDRTWALWLHRALESYRTPRVLVREHRALARVGRVFRDEDELPASADLSREIDQALEQSRFLIVVCSPRTPESRWVDQEIHRFRQLGRPDHILALLVEGEPEDAFPLSLRQIRPDAVSKRGDSLTFLEEIEPLAADVRTARYGSRRAAKRIASLRLLATILGCRFDDLRQRENERQRRRILTIACALTMVILLLTALTFYAFKQRGLAEQRLNDVLRLSDAKQVRDLIDEVDDLWPLQPERGPAMSSWVERARTVLHARRQHESALGRIQSQNHSLRRDTPAGKLAGEELDWQNSVLTEILGGLDRIENPNAPDKGLLAQVIRRYELVTSLKHRSLEEPAEQWARTISVIGDTAHNPVYRGLHIPPQLGLVPLGQDPDSHLFEFAHLNSGTIPARDPSSGKLILADDFAIVLVLIPPTTFLMGAQHSNPGEPNFDPASQADEAPVHPVTLSAFFISKYECTQSQWASLTGGEHPAQYKAGQIVQGRPLTMRNPVEQVSWYECELWARRYGLALPTEAQWECACRAGTDTPWSTGREVARLSSAANIADAYLASHGGPLNWKYTLEVNDGYGVHAPVGSFQPNAFGLQDMMGNVYEWCWDIYAPYSAEAERDPTGPPHIDQNAVRVGRGGSWSDSAEGARSSPRTRDSPGTRNDSLGFRPARPVWP
jgi:formylglycine-generating enzyme required for sulfatase activity